MILDFNKMEKTILKNFNGGDGELNANVFNDGLNKVMHATLEKGSSIGSHCHATSSEILYVMKGQAKFIIDGKEEIVNAGEVHYCKKGSTHELHNESDETLEILAIVPNQ